MNHWYAKGIVLLVTGVMACGLLTACDPGATVHLVQKNKKPFLCPNQEDTKFRFVMMNKNGAKEDHMFSVNPREGPFSTNPSSVEVGIIAGDIEVTMIWMQFTVYCGGSKEPFYVSPKLTEKDFVKEGDRDYYYYVDEGT
ncbi:MAG TPA: hypothetical protein DCO77_12660 [Nitrospiraceae bacterium]|nr:hypothetical protein [Nitrospiraceae bacterium]